MEAVENIGPHYARTLRTWRQRFEESFDQVVVPGKISTGLCGYAVAANIQLTSLTCHPFAALKEVYPDVMDGPNGVEEIQVFKRRWIYY